MRPLEGSNAVRASALVYEQALPSSQRKRLGQYFSGLPLGKLLAHLALNSRVAAVLDPMAGHGDLLDAAWEAAEQRGIRLQRLDGIEIDAPTALACKTRLAGLEGQAAPPQQRIIAGDAFAPASVAALPVQAYDLVITNPPYVRYQARRTEGGKLDAVRTGLAKTIAAQSDPSRHVWRTLIEGYSGLADLSVPAWLQAASLVRSGGTLALVAPATWRSREYAGTIRYLLLRCFKLELVVEDTQPGWFADALVRTHLIIARRLASEEVAVSLSQRKNWASARWVQVAPEASDGDSLVGAAFSGRHPEAQFAAWALKRHPPPVQSIQSRSFSLREEWASLATRAKRKSWQCKLEGTRDHLPLFGSATSFARPPLPEALRDLLPSRAPPIPLVTLPDAGIQAGQGLRTGCNRFFYVTARPSFRSTATVETSEFFGRRQFNVPPSAIRPVLRRQSEMCEMSNGSAPCGRVLDLHGWVLPEDSDRIIKASAAHGAGGATPPQIMPEDLADYVRTAADARLDRDHRGLRIPELSAVKTNVRDARNGQDWPRFWYMLPPFMARHSPAVFVPRVNHHVPRAEANRDPALLIDANFSAIWAPNGQWSRFALKALLNSTWCRACMEALGTPMGGGALKLEAAHLRQLQVPHLQRSAIDQLDRAGRRAGLYPPHVQEAIDGLVVGALLDQSPNSQSVSLMIKALSERAQELAMLRRNRSKRSPGGLRLATGNG